MGMKRRHTKEEYEELINRRFDLETICKILDVTRQTATNNIVLYGLDDKIEIKETNSRRNAMEMDEFLTPKMFAKRKIVCPIVTDLRTGKKYRDITAMLVE